MKILFHSCELHGDFNFKLMAIWNTKNTSNGESKKHINQGPYAMVEGKKVDAR